VGEGDDEGAVQNTLEVVEKKRGISLGHEGKGKGFA